MQIKWLEDFLALTDARAFSRAAARRNISQPTFSRHIQSLENWLGVELIDRREQGVQLTTAGRLFRGFAVETLQRTYDMRTVLREQAPGNLDTIRFSVAHTLSLTFFPGWLSQLKAAHRNVVARVGAVNISEGANALIDGVNDLLIIYHHPQLPVLLDPSCFSHLQLATDRMRPFSAPREDGKPKYRLPGQVEHAIPLLAYSPGTYLAHMVEMILLGANARCNFERSFDTQMSEALKAMIVEGHGMGWLPESCVTQETSQGLLVAAGSEQWHYPLEVRIYRSNKNDNPMVDTIWRWMLTDQKSDH